MVLQVGSKKGEENTFPSGSKSLNDRIQFIVLLEGSFQMTTLQLPVLSLIVTAFPKLLTPKYQTSFLSV